MVSKLLPPPWPSCFNIVLLGAMALLADSIVPNPVKEGALDPFPGFILRSARMPRVPIRA